MCPKILRYLALSSVSEAIIFRFAFASGGKILLRRSLLSDRSHFLKNCNICAVHRDRWDQNFFQNKIVAPIMLLLFRSVSSPNDFFESTNFKANNNKSSIFMKHRIVLQTFKCENKSRYRPSIKSICHSTGNVCCWLTTGYAGRCWKDMCSNKKRRYSSLFSFDHLNFQRINDFDIKEHVFHQLLLQVLKMVGKLYYKIGVFGCLYIWLTRDSKGRNSLKQLLLKAYGIDEIKKTSKN